MTVESSTNTNARQLTNQTVSLTLTLTQWRRLHKARGHVSPHFYKSINQSINQSKHISIAPYVASESEAHKWLDTGGGAVSKKKQQTRN